MVGRLLGHYRIVEKLGSGGMGDVYLAEDTRLGRNVAIKVLPPALTDDAERMQRITREARIVAGLNHPNIAAIYALEEVDRLQALVLELVPGMSLGERLARGRLPVKEALSICRQVAAGLEVAHERGVVHRDVKPANVMITPAGQAKILDFGLAQSIPYVGPDSQTLTQTGDLTKPGAITGTVSYMSPEQARGLPCDEQTDIWSIGCVIYEALTGRRLFAAATTADTLLKILGSDADLSGLPPETPPRIRQLIQRCVRRDPERRLQHMGDVRLELEEDTSEVPAVFPAARRRWLGLTAAVATTFVAGLVGWHLQGRLANRTTPQSVQLLRLTDSVGLEETPAISPDGKTVAFVAEAGGRRQIWLRLLAGGTPLMITRDDVDHYGPRWSPDSASLIYYTPGRQPGEPGTIWQIPALSGTAERLVSAVGPGDLSHDGRNLAFFRFHEGSLELAVISRDQFRTRSVARLPSLPHSHPRWSPNDRRIAFLQEPGGADFSMNLLVADASGSELQNVARGLYLQGFAWIPDGFGLIVSSAHGSTMSYPASYNLWTLPLSGGPRTQLTFGESSYEFPDLDKERRLVVSRVRAQSDVWKFPVGGEPADNARRGVRITQQTGQVQTVSVSPDETEIVFLSDSGGHANVWAARVADGVMRPITYEFDPRVVVAVPFWSPSGDLINFLSSRNSATADVSLWLVRPDGSNPRNLAIIGAWSCWSGDGQWLYYSDSEKAAHRIRKVRIDGGEPVTVRNDNAIGCATAPDGSALYYAKILTQATGAWDFEVRVAKPENGASEVIGQVSGSRVPASATNFQPYLSPDGKWLAMPLNDGSTSNLWALSASGGAWRKLTDFSPRNVVITRRIAWSKDGKHLYASVAEVDSDIVMLSGLNW